MLKTALMAIGLVLVVEGTLYALFPSSLRAMLAQMRNMDTYALRIGGMVALSIGVGLIWITR